ncbi:MAG TPA: Maf family protein [Mariprofundaceae bacterium]|nr:Maf family protein [Mariprofundaceae bacterium]
MEIILASRSPRRLQLLQGAGLAVEVRPSHVDESALPGETVDALVHRLARSKALTCTETSVPVIAADTLVALDGEALGQPVDLAAAKIMLQRLSGRQHVVVSGVCVRLGEKIEQTIVRTEVRFRPLDEREIDIYLLHNEVLDKAGAYAVQGGAAGFIEGIDGPLDNVIGLPVRATLNLLQHVMPSHASGAAA